MIESAVAPAALGLAELGMLVLGSDGGPVILLTPTEAAFSNPSQVLGLSNPSQTADDSNPS